MENIEVAEQVLNGPAQFIRSPVGRQFGSNDIEIESAMQPDHMAKAGYARLLDPPAWMIELAQADVLGPNSHRRAARRSIRHDHIVVGAALQVLLNLLAIKLGDWLIFHWTLNSEAFPWAGLKPSNPCTIQKGVRRGLWRIQR